MPRWIRGFGRAPYILVVDSDTDAFEALDNSENVNALKGGGHSGGENGER